MPSLIGIGKVVADTMSARKREAAALMNDKPRLDEMFKQKASFLGAVGTTYDVEDVSSVQRNVIMSTMGVTTSSSDSDEEWRRDIDYILSMFVDRGFEGNVQVMKRTGNGPELTDVSIGIDKTKKEMTVMKKTTPAKTFSFDEKKELIKFLEEHITKVMKLKLIDIVFRTFG